MKNYQTLSLAVILFSLITMLLNCSKKDDNNPSNPTNGKTTAIFNPDLTYGTMTDQDGNTYKTIKIGTQTWMAENLRTVKYRNGDSIPTSINDKTWATLSTGTYCNYENTTDKEKIATYGRLYNWFIIDDSRNIAPIGWHVPTDAEWTTLTTFLGGDSIAGSQLKEIGTTHWRDPNKSATNFSGFTALPSGQHTDWGVYNRHGFDEFYWSSTQVNDSYAINRNLGYNGAGCHHSGLKKEFGYAIRCVKD